MRTVLWVVTLVRNTTLVAAPRNGGQLSHVFELSYGSRLVPSTDAFTEAS
jgi:hypothetical protein